MRGRFKDIQHGNKGATYETKNKAAQKCAAFWKLYYDTLAPVISDKLRAKPPDQVMTEVYRNMFVGHCSATYPNEDVPSEATFNRSKKLPMFSDVKKKDKHYHCRCDLCSQIRIQQMASFVPGPDSSPEDVEFFKKAKIHRKDVEVPMLCHLSDSLLTVAIGNSHGAGWNHTGSRKATTSQTKSLCLSSMIPRLLNFHTSEKGHAWVWLNGTLCGTCSLFAGTRSQQIDVPSS